MTRILVAGLGHETHSFVDEITGFDLFHFTRGAGLVAKKGDGSTIDAFLTHAAGAGWEVVPSVAAHAIPSGTVDHAVFEAFLDEVLRDLRAAIASGIDGIWLALHGAMVTTRSVDPEGELLAAIRAVPGAEALPLFGVFDLHANFTDAMARHADALVAYRENPHTDAYAASALSVRLMARTLDTGVRPRLVNRTTAILWPPTGTGTADPAMAALARLAREIEARDPAIWAVNVVAGYSYADTPQTGVSFQVMGTMSDALASDALDALERVAWDSREAGIPREWDLEAAIDDALARGVAGPVVLVEPSDNIGGGAPGDGTSILRAFLRRGLAGVVVIADPGTVRDLEGTPIGGTKRVRLGGKGSTLDPGPVDLEVEVLGRTDGAFTLEDRQSHLAALNGVHVSMGPCVTVRAGPVTILVTSIKTAPFDLGQLRTQGIVPETIRFVGVKAAVAHRRAYDRVAAASYWVTTPGPCVSDSTLLPFRQIRRPVFPLDPPWRPT